MKIIICNFEYSKKFNEIIKSHHFTVDKTSIFIQPKFINNKYYDQSIDVYAFCMKQFHLNYQLFQWMINCLAKKLPLNPKSFNLNKLIKL